MHLRMSHDIVSITIKTILVHTHELVRTQVDVRVLGASTLIDIRKEGRST